MKTSEFRHAFVVGQVSEGHGAAWELALTVELRRGERRTLALVENANQQTVYGLKPIDGLELSITGEAYDARTGADRTSGQCRDALREVIEDGGLSPDLTDADVRELLRIWEEWHLNAMRAGCEHQRAAGWRSCPRHSLRDGWKLPEPGQLCPGGEIPRAIFLAWDRAHQTEREKRAAVPSPFACTADKLSKPCPTCGYKFGSAWLFEPLPADVEAFVRGLARLPLFAGSRARQAQHYEAHGLALAAVDRTDRNPQMQPGDMDQADHWKVTLTSRKTGRRFTLVYSKGTGHHGAPPTLPEVLECLVNDAQSFEASPDFESWAAELGMDADSRRAEKIYKAVKHQTDELQRVCGEDVFRALLK